MSKTFSIVVPVYKVEKYITKCLESILAQTFSDFELICVDDCGGDKSLEIIKDFAKKDKRIKILENEKNSGVAFSRNRGIDEASGKYLMFIDSDDWIEPQTLGVIYKTFQEIDANSIIYDGYYFDEDRQKRRSGSIMECSRGYLEYTPNTICHGSDYLLKAYKTESIKDNKIYYPVGINFEDGEFYFKYFSLNPKTYILDEKLYNYRVREGSIVTNARKGIVNIEDIYAVIKHLKEFYIENGLYNKYKRALMQLVSMRINTCKGICNNYEKSLKLSKELLDEFNYPEEFSEFNESQTPFFSVIVPFYNVENYIEECIRSIQAQTFTDFEIICVDDRGQDNSYEIVKRLAKDDKRIRIIRHKKNESLGSARNTALRNAKGRYVICVDSDDYILPNCFEVVHNKILETSLNTVWFKVNIWWEDIKRMTDMCTFPIMSSFKEGHFSVTKDNIIDFPMCTWNKAYNREFLLKNNVFWPEKVLFEDHEFFIRAMIADSECYMIDKPLYIYRRRGDSIIGTSIQKPEKAKEVFEAARRVYCYLKDSGNFDEYKNAYVRYAIDIINTFRCHPNTQQALYPYMKKYLEDINFPNDYMDLAD